MQTSRDESLGNAYIRTDFGIDTVAENEEGAGGREVPNGTEISN